MPFFDWYLVLALLLPSAPAKLSKKMKLVYLPDLIQLALTWSCNLYPPKQMVSCDYNHFGSWGVRSTKSMAHNRLCLYFSPLRKASAGCPCQSSRWRNRQQSLQRTPDIDPLTFQDFQDQDSLETLKKL